MTARLLQSDVTLTDLLPQLPAVMQERLLHVGEHVRWTGWHNDDGYGYVRWDGRDQPVHRVVWVLLVAPIPAGYEVDHLCRVRDCVLHLELVTHAENQRRLSRAQTACRRANHDWTDPRNVRVRPNGRRYCAECDRINLRARYAARKAAAR